MTPPERRRRCLGRSRETLLVFVRWRHGHRSREAPPVNNMVHRADIEVESDCRLRLRPALDPHAPEDVRSLERIARMIVRVTAHKSKSPPTQLGLIPDLEKRHERCDSEIVLASFSRPISWALDKVAGPDAVTSVPASSARSSGCMVSSHANLRELAQPAARG